MAELDPDVLVAAQAGAGWAMERLYVVLAPAVQGYLRAQGCTDPEGGVNDVFLRAFRNLATFDGDPARFRSWVFTIAHNLVLDQRRFAFRRPREVPLDDPAFAPGDADAVDTADVAVRTLTMQRLARQLDLLTPEQRDVLLLRFVLDLGIEEVARVQDRSVGATKALQHRALEAVRRRLQEIPEIADEAVSPMADPTLTEV